MATNSHLMNEEPAYLSLNHIARITEVSVGENFGNVFNEFAVSFTVRSILLMERSCSSVSAAFSPIARRTLIRKASDAMSLSSSGVY